MPTISKKISNRTGRITYHVKVRLRGHLPESATFDRRTDANNWAAKIESDMRAGRHLKTSKSRKHTVGEMIERYQNEYLPNNPKREEGLCQKLSWWKTQLGHCLLSDVSKSLILDKRAIIIATPKIDGSPRTPATVNRYMAVLSSVFTIAMNEWEWLEVHPMRRISKLPEPRGRVRFLSDDERKRLLAACKKSRCSQLHVIVTLALSTGARLSEIMTLTWQNVDLERRMIVLHHTKNGERRVLPISSIVLPLLQEHLKGRTVRCDYLFPAPRGNKPLNVRFAFETAVKAANIQDFRFHDLRHSAASYMAMNGAVLSEIAEVLGHKTLNMVKRYAHLSDSHVSSVVESMNNKIFS